MRHKQWDGHPKAESFLDHSLQVRQLVGVGLSDRDINSKYSVKLIPQLPLNFRVVYQLRNAPFNGP